MDLTRRDFLKASSAVAAAFGIQLPDALGAPKTAGEDGPPSVVWLQTQGCTGCSVSLLNSITIMSVGELLINTVNLEYHPTVMAAAGQKAIDVARKFLNQPLDVLVVEGAIPTAKAGKYCYLWPGLTALRGVQDFARNAAFVLAVGTCSSFGGIPAAGPNPTGARSLGAVISGTRRVINIPGCPAHPDWIVGTVAYLLTHGEAPPVDSLRRPREFFSKKLHEQCPNKDNKDRCLKPYGCKGQKTRADCPTRKWNSPGPGAIGVNWCVESRSPCQGCTEPGFPGGMSPFYANKG